MSSNTLAYRHLVHSAERFHFATSLVGSVWSELHDHDFVEVFWVLEGRGCERLPDRPQEQDIALAPGSFALVRPEDRHAFRSQNRPLRFRNLAFPLADLKRLARRYPAWRNPFAPPDVADRRFRISQSSLAALELVAAPAVQGDRGVLTLDRLLMAVELLTRSVTLANPAAPRWLTVATNTETLRAGVDAFVDACQRSPEHVARTCKTVLGKTPTQLVNAARLDHAARLLEETELSVLNVCYESGFNNVGHFHACFRQRFTLTPAAYRDHASASVPSGRAFVSA